MLLTINARTSREFTPISLAKIRVIHGCYYSLNRYEIERSLRGRLRHFCWRDFFRQHIEVFDWRQLMHALEAEVAQEVE